MRLRGRATGAWSPGTSRRPRLIALLLAGLLATGCDVPFDPFQENLVGPFSIFGTLDLRADTQWVRVMPIRSTLLPDSTPIDAVVTLQHLGTGRVVTLRDSIFRFTDPRLEGAAYAHNFWTAEPLEPGATYRLAAVRSDGEATTAVIEMPPELEITLQYWAIPERPPYMLGRQVFVNGEYLLYVDVMYTVWDPTIDRGASPVSLRQQPRTTVPGQWSFTLPGVGPLDVLDVPPFIDMFRREVRLGLAESDWPYEPGLSPTDIAVPGSLPTTVENGVGSVWGVATWTIPLPYCEPLEARPGGGEPCTTTYDASSASVVGKVIRDPCADPMALPVLRLTERYEDGGAVVWEWTADWEGNYAFEGIRPGSELLLEFAAHPTGAIAIPALEPGERLLVPEVTLPVTCGAAAAGT